MQGQEYSVGLEERYPALTKVTRHLSSGAARRALVPLQGWLSWGQRLGNQRGEERRKEKGEGRFHLNTEEFRLYPESNGQGMKVFKHQMCILKLLKHLKIREGTIPSLPFNK